MARLLALPAHGEVFLDARGAARVLRLTWHHEDEVVVLSLWRESTCTGTFRLGADDVPALVDSLVAGLGRGYDGRCAAG